MFTEGQKKIAEGKKQVHVAQVKAEKGQKKIDEGEVKTHKAVSALLAIRTLLVEISSYYRKMHEVKKEKQARTQAAELGDPESISWLTTYLENADDNEEDGQHELEELKEKWIMTLSSQGIEAEANKLVPNGMLSTGFDGIPWKMFSDQTSTAESGQIDRVQQKYINPGVREKEDFEVPAPGEPMPEFDHDEDENDRGRGGRKGRGRGSRY
eukprot:gnl/TRDRNA2_/TRDRNA2_175877_c1_seq26.p1 gnl/TRDRNA2_/TRDRNA2_175877_c1~~gnl/TRDRNA2_/TRDRNA2_175877_c1_seq26.p1  ORF type:complete len:211 (+),score=44.17 gnl/TRDRNA2_/TRDRNA2_175877_c1_seq26:376-1008(+)